ncbi:MAG: ABC transporter permease [Gemmatimonadetes bacterium]|nr:ABC transporter permease [Gemmatimonadota bacterium]
MPRPPSPLLRPILGALDQVQQFTLLTVRTVASVFQRPYYVRDTVDQMDHIGFGSLVIVCLTGIFTGMVLALQSSVELAQFGATAYVGRLVSASAVRELGPVLTGLMVAGRVGSGISAELGSMKVSEQVEALEAMGTDPLKKLVKPRFIACVLMLPILTVLTDFIAIVGGQLIATLSLNQPATLYWNSAFATLLLSDIFTGLAKPIAFGAIIALVACYNGLRTAGGTAGVGRATTNTVVASSILILASDYLLTEIFISLFPT